MKEPSCSRMVYPISHFTAPRYGGKLSPQIGRGTDPKAIALPDSEEAEDLEFIMSSQSKGTKWGQWGHQAPSKSYSNRVVPRCTTKTPLPGRPSRTQTAIMK